jgi:hypothetical protein
MSFLGKSFAISTTYPKIVTDGLVLNLDAGQQNSYPGSGTTWTDLSGNGRNFSLFNSSYYSYSSSNGGSIGFTRTMPPTAETGGYAEHTGSGALAVGRYLYNDHTTEIWAKINDVNPTAHNVTEAQSALFVYRGYHAMFYYSASELIYSIWSGTSGQGVTPPLTLGTSGTDIIQGQWFHAVAVRSGNNLSSYINGNLKGTNIINTSGGSGSTTNTIRMGMANPSNEGYSWHMNANVSAAKMYNRALSAAEVLQNYNALKSRFYPSIVTSGLVLNLDAGNTSSYPGSGTTWNDLSGNGQNFTLYNSPTFSSNNGGEILFSGSNDYARIRNSSSIDLLSSNGTVEVWFRTISSTLGSETYVRLISFSDETGTGSDTTSTQGTNRDYSDYFCLVKNNTAESIAVWYKNNPNAFGPATLVNTNTYFNAVVSWSTSGASMTFNFYLNGTNTNTSTVTQSGYNVNASTITIGQNCIGALTSPFENSSCAFSSVKLYNRALSAAEIQQNFNALRNRFGI